MPEMTDALAHGIFEAWNLRLDRKLEAKDWR